MQFDPVFKGNFFGIAVIVFLFKDKAGAAFASVQSCQLGLELSLPDFNDAVGILPLFFRAGDMMKCRIDVVRQVYLNIL